MAYFNPSVFFGEETFCSWFVCQPADIPYPGRYLLDGGYTGFRNHVYILIGHGRIAVTADEWNFPLFAQYDVIQIVQLNLTHTNDGTNWTTENDPSPEGWRVPTTEEMAALWEKGATWVTAAQTGFKTDGIIIGVDEATAKRATKDNLKQLGCLFLPQSGWRNETGMMDRTWLCAVRSGNSLSPTHGGMSLGDSGGYRDTWGWGDGQKARAAMIRPVKNIQVED